MVPLGRQVQAGLLDLWAQMDLQVQPETEGLPDPLDSQGRLGIKELGAKQVHRVTKDRTERQGLLASRVLREILDKRVRSGSLVVLVLRERRVPPDSLVQQDKVGIPANLDLQVTKANLVMQASLEKEVP